MRNVIPLFCVRALHLEPSSASAVSLAFAPALLMLLAFHSIGAAGMEDSAARISLWRSPVTRWLAAYLAFAGASFAWGTAVSPLSSAAYWCALLVDGTMIFLLLSMYPPNEVAESVLRGYVWGAVLLAVFVWILPAQADLRLGDPDFFNTNQIANLCAFAIFFAQYLQRRGALAMKPMMLFLSLTLLRTLSKTTLLAFIFSQGVLLFRDRNISSQTRRRALLWAACVLSVFSGLLISYYDVYTNAGNQAQTLTGRTAIWAWAAAKLPESLWFGHGFDSMWKVMPPFGIDFFEARHAENELLQQLYAYGIFGTALFCGVYLSFFRSTRRSVDAKTRPILKAILLFVLIRGLAEAEPFDLLLPTWVLLVLAATTLNPAMSVEAPATG